jgi:hypothetical protein
VVSAGNSSAVESTAEESTVVSTSVVSVVSVGSKLQAAKARAEAIVSVAKILFMGLVVFF